MKSIKNDLLAQIEAKAKKIENCRSDALNNRMIESFCFAFFKNWEESLQTKDTSLSSFQKQNAIDCLRNQIRSWDSRSNAYVVYQDNNDVTNAAIQGVKIVWSDLYVAQNKCDRELYIDVSQALFF